MITRAQEQWLPPVCSKHKWCVRPDRHRGVCTRNTFGKPAVSKRALKHAISSTYGKGVGSMAFEMLDRQRDRLARLAFADVALELGFDRAETVLKRVREAARELTT